MLAVLEWSTILQVIWVSAVMGVGSIVLFALAIYGSSRSNEARRTGTGSQTGFGAVALVSLLGVAAVVVFAITVILQKS